MGFRDVATDVYIQLQSIRAKLDDIENCIDFDEAIFVAQELSADVETLEQTLDVQFELGMNEE